MEKKLLNLPTVRVDESLYADMHALAEIRGVHLADLIREACIAHLRAVEDEYHPCTAFLPAASVAAMPLA